MKKKFVILIIGILTLTFCVNSCSKKNDNKSEIVKNKNSKVNNSEMTVPGYALGEVPIIQIPEIPNLSVTENPAAKITLDMTKKISSVPGITITPVKVENGDILGGNYTAQIGKDGKGQLSEGNKVVQSDGNGAGQYTDEKVTIQRDQNGAGQYINNVTGVTLQVDSKGAGQYTDEKNGISLQVNDNGTGMYKNENNGIDIMINEEGATYTSANLVIENNSDGSGEYHDKSKNFLIENNGKGKAIITYNGKTTEVAAKPVGKPARFPKLKMEISLKDGREVLVFLRRPNFFPVEYFAPLESKHLAWVISRMENICCELKYSGIEHGCIDQTSIWINPVTHEGALFGDWRKVKPLVGNRDLADVRRTAIRIVKNSREPIELYEFLNSKPAKDAFDDFQAWDDVIEKGFGGHKFIKM